MFTIPGLLDYFWGALKQLDQHGEEEEIPFA
jgi:hypothetical protein